MNALKRTTLAAALLTGFVGLAFAGSPNETAKTPPAQSQLEESQIQREFAQLDVDKNGNLTAQEAQKDLQLKEDFAKFDVDHNQLLSKVEYRSFAIAQLDPVDMDEEEEAE